MSAPLRTLAAAAALCIANVAQAAPPAPVEGAWTFTTAEYHVYETDGFRTYTTVEGDLQVGAAQGGAHRCNMRTTQNWYEQKARSKPVVTDSMSSVQTCTLTRDGDKITIVGTIVSATSDGYRADDFTLTLESSSRMIGQMHSRWQENRPVAKAIFQRGPGMTS
jgi:hypothetical protein